MPRKDINTLRLILGDQLDSAHSWFSSPDDGVVYALMEVRQETDYVMHHVQKVLAFFAAMRRFAAELRRRGHRVHYIALDDHANTQSIEGNIRYLITKYRPESFEYLLPDEYRLDRQLASLAEDLPIPGRALDTEHFLTGRDDVREHFSGRKTYLMESFYRMMRKRHGILMDGEGPAGGAWNFDRENRRPYDGAVPVPEPLLFRNDVRELSAMLERSGVKTFGSAGATIPWPVDRRQARRILSHFTKKLLPHFGTYEDAMSSEHRSLFHSRLSFALNSKILHPLEVIEAAAGEYRAGRVPINDAEGFIRQILGWREYMRGMYWALMPGFARMNRLGNRRKLPRFYWDGDTKMNCMRESIRQSLETAWAHHIQRLMVTGNFALLAGVHPGEVDRWYLGIYIDAVEWVEITNTRGMSQFADGGIIATKPYVSSARYIEKMSDYCSSCPYESGRRHGDGACPFNSLYWAFFERHRKKLSRNPRVAMMYRVWDGMEESERKAVLAQARRYLRNIDRL